MAAWSVGEQSIEWVSVSSGSYGSDGRYDAGSETTTTIKATVNPVPGKVLMTLPEGERSEENLRVLTETEMAVADDYDNVPGDIVIVRGRRYEVRDVAVYERVIPHFEYRVRRIRPNPSP